MSGPQTTNLEEGDAIYAECKKVAYEIQYLAHSEGTEYDISNALFNLIAVVLDKQLIRRDDE